MKGGARAHSYRIHVYFTRISYSATYSGRGDAKYPRQSTYLHPKRITRDVHLLLGQYTMCETFFTPLSTLSHTTNHLSPNHPFIQQYHSLYTSFQSLVCFHCYCYSSALSIAAAVAALTPGLARLRVCVTTFGPSYDGHVSSYHRFAP